MNPPQRADDDVDRALVAPWLEAAQRPQVSAAIESLYAEIADAIAARRPRCVASGRCCHFESFGHRLYVTGLEAAWSVLRLERPLSAIEVREAESRGDCPFLSGTLCSVHAIKPMGCRVFFCDATAKQWQEELYERSQCMLRDLHDRENVPYRYQEWRSLLRMFTMEAVDPDTSGEEVVRHAREGGHPLIAQRSSAPRLIQVRVG